MRERYCEKWTTVGGPYLALHFSSPPPAEVRESAKEVAHVLEEFLMEEAKKGLPESLVNMLLYGQETKP